MHYNQSPCPPAGYPVPPSTCGCSHPPEPTAPTYPPSQPLPVPMMSTGSLGSLMQVAAAIGGAAVDALGASVDTRKLCGPWKPVDGLTEAKLCCTPAVGRTGGAYKAAVCLKLTRPIDPWASMQDPGVIPQ